MLSSRQRHDSPIEFTSSTLPVLQHFALLQHGLLISSIPSQATSNYYSYPSKNHKSPAEHLQDKIKHQNHNNMEIYHLNQDAPNNINHIHASYIINIFIHCIHYLICLFLIYFEELVT